MLVRIVIDSLTRHLRRKLLSGIAVALGIAVATALGTMALDVGDRVSRELRSFGANISVRPAADSLPIAVGGVDYRPQAAAGAFLAEADLVKLKRIFWRNNIVAFAPFLYVPAKISEHPTVLIGTWFDKGMRVDEGEIFRTGLKQLHPTWKVAGQWPRDDEATTCLVGRRLAGALGIRQGATVYPSHLGGDDRRPVAVTAASSPLLSIALQVRGILETGGPEDDQIMAPLPVVQKLAGLEGKVRRVEVSALTKPEDEFARSDVSKLTPKEFDRWYCAPYVRSIAFQIGQAIGGAEAKPVYQVAETEGRILNRLGLLMGILAAAALTTSALAVASVMLATMLERRAEIGLFKSLGAGDAHVAAIFLSEALVVALLGGVTGYAAGSLLARRLAVAIFGAPAGIHWVIFPAAVTLALVVTLLGCAMPLARGLKISPAVVLRD